MTFLGAMFAQPLPWPGKLRLAGEEATLRADELRSGIGRPRLALRRGPGPTRLLRAPPRPRAARARRGPEPFLARDLGDRPRTLRRRYRRAAGRPAGASRGAAPRRGPGRPERPGRQSPRGAQSPARSTPGGADRDGPETGLPATGPGAARVAPRDPPAKPRARRTLSRDRSRPVAGPADEEGVPAGLRRERRPDVPREGSSPCGRSASESRFPSTSPRGRSRASPRPTRSSGRIRAASPPRRSSSSWRPESATRTSTRPFASPASTGTESFPRTSSRSSRRSRAIAPGRSRSSRVLEALNTLYADRALYLSRLADAEKWRVAIDEADLQQTARWPERPPAPPGPPRRDVRAATAAAMAARGHEVTRMKISGKAPLFPGSSS